MGLLEGNSALIAPNPYLQGFPTKSHTLKTVDFRSK